MKMNRPAETDVPAFETAGTGLIMIKLKKGLFA